MNPNQVSLVVLRYPPSSHSNSINREWSSATSVRYRERRNSIPTSNLNVETFNRETIEELFNGLNSHRRSQDGPRIDYHCPLT